MGTQKDDIQDLFSMFHDFNIITVQYETDILILQVEIPWSQLWDEDEIFRIRLELGGCNYLYCDYQESVDRGPYKSIEHINFDRIEYSTKDIATITSLNLSIQSYEFKEPNCYTFYCRGNEKIDEGQLMFTTDRYMLYDESGNNLSLDKMKELATMWWDSIQKMWDSQKNEK